MSLINENSLRRMGAMGLIALFICVYAVSSHIASGGRGFFSPDTLQSKSQSEILLPFTEIPIYRSAYRFHRYDLVDYLIEHQYWTESNVEEPRWEPTFHWNRQWHSGSSNLQRQLGSRGDQWIEWSNNHPEIAAEFWPRVLELLRQPEPSDIEVGMLDQMWMLRITSVETLEDYRSFVQECERIARHESLDAKME